MVAVRQRATEASSGGGAVYRPAEGAGAFGWAVNERDGYV